MHRAQQFVVATLLLAAMATFGTSSAFAAQPISGGAASISVPATASAASNFAITISLPRGTAAIEGRVLLDKSAAEVVGLASLGGGVALAPAETSNGYAFAAYNLRSATPTLKAVVAPQVAGQITVSVVIDSAADASGHRVTVTGTITRAVNVDNGHARFAAPRAAVNVPLRAAGALRDVVADGLDGKLDLDEVNAAWQDSHASDAVCGALIDPAADANNDGCIDVVDLQAVYASKGQRFYGAPLLRTSDTASLIAAPAVSTSSSPDAVDRVTASSVTITVTSTADTPDAKPSDGICADSKGRCTLRAAVTTANWTSGANTIAFKLTGSAPVVIAMDPKQPDLLLNDRSGGTTIDGYTQKGSSVNTATNGSNAVMGVMLKGVGASVHQPAIRIVSANNTVRGLAIRNAYRSISMDGPDSSNNTIIGNWIGFTSKSTAAAYNGKNNIWIADGANHNTVGTPALADRNVSGGGTEAIALYGAGTDYNTIQNNVFCIAPDGSSDVGGCAVGVDLSFGASHTMIGGDGTRQRNVFGWTNHNGVEIAHAFDNGADQSWNCDYNSIIGNWIGFKLNGDYDKNYLSGVQDPALHPNSNDSNGINLADGSNLNIAQDNYIGAAWDGVNLMNSNSFDNVVQNNIIGTSPNGQAAPMKRYGINVRGGVTTQTIVGNNIANAAVYGIGLVHTDDSLIKMSQNIIASMTGPAIYLTNGANDGIKPPTISAATTVAVSGTAQAGATVEVYRASRNAGQNGLPVAYLGSATANTNGNWLLGVSLTTGQRVTALQIATNNDTSALANNALVSTGSAVKPSANFTFSQESGSLKVDFTDTSSGGPATSWSWDFGDGSSSTAENPKHTFASAATYNVKLTASNAAGSSSMTKSVVVSGSTSAGLVADAFGRTVANGWGSADTGGAYTVTGSASNYKVLNGAGSVLMPSANSNASAILYGVSAASVDMKFRIAVDNPPAGGNVLIYAVARRTSSGEYRARISLNPDGSVSISASKLVGTTETKLGSSVVVPGVSVISGSYIWFRAQVTGTGTTTINAKAWNAGGSEPGSWQLTTTDTTSALQGAGNVGLRLWLSNTATDAPIQVGFDDYSVNPS